MDTTLDNNPFQNNGEQPQTNGSEPSYHKGSLLLDLDAGAAEKYKQNVAADSPTATDLYFLNRTPAAANGKEDTSCYDDDDFGPETDVDAVDDVLLSPAIAAAKAAMAAIESAGDLQHPIVDHVAAFEADLELQKQQLSAFDEAMEPRDETPTPPADHVTDGDVLVPELPEADNVGESGEDSEDEWNYYKVEPTEKTDEPAAKADPQQAAEEVDDDDNMEYRLNPNAAEFVPSPTAMMPSMEELLAGSPKKGGVSMDDVTVPSPVEFEHEVSLRPAEVGAEDALTKNDEVPYNAVPDFLNGHNVLDTEKVSSTHIETGFGEFREPLNPFKNAEHMFDKSEVSSTHAEYGDDTATSFMTSMLETTSEHLQKVSDDLNASMAEADFQAASFFEEVNIASKNSVDFLGSDIVQNNQEPNTIPISLEFQNEFSSTAQNKYEEVMVHNEDYPAEMNSTPFNIEHDYQSDGFPAMFNSNTGNVAEPFNPLDGFSASLNPQYEEKSSPFNLQLDPQATEFSSQMSPVQMASPVSGGHNTSVDVFADLVTSMEQPPSTADLIPNIEPELTFGNDLLNNFSEREVQSSVPDIVQQSSITNGIQNLDLHDNAAHEADECTFDNEQTAFVNIESTISHTQDSSLEAFESHVSNKNSFNEYLNGPTAEILKDSVTLSSPINESEVIQENVIEADLENLPDTVSELSTDIKVVAAVAATALAASAVIAGTAAAAEEKPNKDNTIQKTTKKTTATDKTKPIAGTRAPAKTPLKSNPTKAPTSPPPMAAPRSSSTPKKPMAASSTRVASKTPVTSASKASATPGSNVAARAKPLSATTKPVAMSKLTSTKTTTSSVTAARPRPATATATATKPAADKKPTLTNGSAKPPIKRPDPLAIKKTVSVTASKPLTRPASAPVVPKSTVPRTAVSSTVTKTAPKPAVNGIAKPKPAATASSLTARAKPATATSRAGLLDKQVKEMANKQISQTVTSKTSTVTRTATTSVARKTTPGAATKTSTVKTTTTTTNKSGPIRRPAGTTVTKTTLTKTVDGQVEKNEEVVVEDATTVTKDDSPIVDNAQPMVIASAD